MMGGPQVPAGGVPDEMLKTLINAARDIDQMLEGMASAFGPDGGQEMAKARDMIKAGVSTFMAKHGAPPGGGPSSMGAGGPAPTPGPTPPPPGPGFPGGGFTSV
jgi:hypothetical protein